MLNPRALGTIKRIAEKGSYSVDVCLLSYSRAGSDVLFIWYELGYCS